MADQFEFRTSNTQSGDALPAEDFTINYTEIKHNRSDDGLGFTKGSDDQALTEEVGMNFEEIVIRYPPLDPAGSHGSEPVDDVFIF